MSNRPGYKTAGINKIPEDWKFVRLGEILEEVDLRARNVGNVKDLPILSLTKNFGLIPQEQRFSKRIATRDLSNYKIIRKGWLVYNPYVIWEGAIYFLRNMEAGILSPAYVTWKPKKKADYYFMDYLLRTGNVLSTFFSLSTGVVQRRRSIKKKDFLDVLIPFPPFPEQQRISEVLLRVDEAIQKTNAIMGKAEMLKRGLMQRLLTRGIGHNKFKQTDLGEIPEAWKVIELSDIVTSYKNGIYKRSEFYGRGFPSIRMHNIQDGKINPEGAPLLEVTEKEVIDYGLRPEDIVINRVNTLELVGKSGIVEENIGTATFESKNIRVRINREKCNPRFLTYLLNANQCLRQIRACAKAAIGQATINQSDLDRIKLVLPLLYEQEKIVAVLLEADKKIQYEKLLLKKYEELKNGLMQVLLTGKVQVKVD